MHSRESIAKLIMARLAPEETALKNFYAHSGNIAYFFIDDLLPKALASSIAASFPGATDLHFKSTLRERKFVSSQMNRHNSLLEEALFAFHDDAVVSIIQRITGHPILHADPRLYAGGISRMEKDGFLNPHIDNSHNKDRTLWRSLNLLYYISPEWKLENGGNLELWPDGMGGAPIVVESHFNRLVVMATHQHSLHSVSPITVDAARNCISNYYFSDTPMHADQQFHITAFRGRPEQKLRDAILRADAFLRTALRHIKSGGFFKTGHWYETE